jgi:uncharacterized protein
MATAVKSSTYHTESAVAPILHEEVPQKMMYVSWDQYYKTAEALMKMVYQSNWEFDHIVCIVRGGMPLGDMVSRVFKKPLAVIIASSYVGANGMHQKKLVISDIAKIAALGKKVLLVDDLADSGITMREIKERVLTQNRDVEEVRTAVLWCKTCSEFKPDYFAETVDKDVWIVQPFERYDQMNPKDLVE